MTLTTQKILILLLAISTFGACDPYQIYEKPDYLTGKLYTELGTLDNVEIFKYCIEKVGLDSVIDVSGYYTLMAPTDSAFEIYLAANGYASVDDIALHKLEQLVRYHILQGGFTPEQLISLSSTGWIDSSNSGAKTNTYKRETILQPDNKLYNIRKASNSDQDDQLVLSGSLYSDAEYQIFSAIRKYVPIHFQSYFDIGDFNAEDFDFYFDRSFESNYLYYADAKILGSNRDGVDNPAENGFIYTLDRVVEPLLNVEDVIISKPNGNSYDKILSSIYTKSKVVINEEATKDQVGYEDGLATNLYDVSYEYNDGLKFDIASEGTRESYIGKPYERPYIASTHNGLYLINDVDYDAMLGSFVGKPNYYSRISDLEPYVYDEILNAYMSRELISHSKLKTGYYSENYDYIKEDESNVEFAYYGSNATVIALKTPFVPDVFTSVVAALYLQPRYSLMRRAVVSKGFQQMLKNPQQSYTFFPLYNSVIDNSSTTDSSLMVNSETSIQFNYYERNEEKSISLNADLPTLILNHISEESVDQKSDVEFLQTLSGHYIRIDHTNNIVEGASTTTYGYMGKDPYPIQLSQPERFDNGDVYPVSTWFELPTSTLEGVVAGLGSQFMVLLKYVGLVNSFGELLINPLENYTVFVPSNVALNSLDTASITKDELKSILLNHFVPSYLIFTDNDFEHGNYMTLSGRRLLLSPARDVIQLAQNDGTAITMIQESNGLTNMMSKRDLEFNTSSIGDDITNGVVHLCNQVLILND